MTWEEPYFTDEKSGMQENYIIFPRAPKLKFESIHIPSSFNIEREAFEYLRNSPEKVRSQ